MLVTKDNRVKISDFGVSHQSSDEGDHDYALAKTAGTPAFFAPELCAGSSTPHMPTTKAIDIWALGVTLYCFVYGHIPFQAETPFEMYAAILNDPLTFDEDEDVTDSLKDLLRRMLEKDPTKRITISEIKAHAWVTEDLSDPKEWRTQTDPTRKEAIHVTLDEVKQALTIFGKFKRHIRRLSVTLTNKLKPSSSLSPTPVARPSAELDSDASSFVSSSRLRSPSGDINEMSGHGSGMGHFRSLSNVSISSNVSSNGNFRPTIKSSISQELFSTSDSDSFDDLPPGRKSPRPNLKEIEEEESERGSSSLYGDTLQPTSPVRFSSRKDKSKSKPF